MGLGLLATTFWKFSSSISLGKEIDGMDGVGGWGCGGSICYIPVPEQRQRRSETQKADIFPRAVVLLRLSVCSMRTATRIHYSPLLHISPHPSTTSPNLLSAFPPTTFSSTHVTGAPTPAPNTHNPVATNCHPSTSTLSSPNTLANFTNSPT